MTAAVATQDVARVTELLDEAVLAERMLNGFPALVVDLPGATAPNAPRVVIRCDLEKHGRIDRLHLVLAPRKLSALMEGRRPPRVSE